MNDFIYDMINDDYIKDYVIESEEDIPEQYRKVIEEMMNKEKQDEQKYTGEIIEGKKGKSIKEEINIKEIFENNDECYLGHGTPLGESIIDLILKEGLNVDAPESSKGYCSTLRGLDSTTLAFGIGSKTIYDDYKELLNNWPHKNSKNVIIISIPKEYILSYADINQLADNYKPFYIGSKEEGFNLRPEFIKGVYNAVSQSFTINDNFYKNLSEEQQKELFNQLKQNYINAYAEYALVSPQKTETNLPLNEDEKEQLIIKWYKTQLEKLRENKTFDSEMLDKQLSEMAEESRISTFEEVTNSIKNDAQQEKNNEKENTNEWREEDIEW